MKASLCLFTVIFILSGCGSRVDIKDCDNSLVWIEQSSEQKTDNQIPVSLTDASQMLKGLADLPSVVEELAPDNVPEEIKEDPLPLEPAASIGSWSCKEYTHISGDPAKSTCRIALDFKKHDYAVTFKFNNNCGEFTIPTATVDYPGRDNSKDGFVYFVYEKGTPAVFTPVGCVSTSVEAFTEVSQ